jgi:type IV pilus assembly protein PilB
MSTIPLSGLARRLVRDGILTEQAAHEAFQTASREKQPFVRYVVKNNLADARRIAEAASDEFGTPLLDLKAFSTASIPKDLVNADLVNKHHSLPLFKRGNRLFVAVSDPTNLRALDDIKFNTGINTDAVLVEEDALAEAIAAFLESADTTAGALKGLDDAGLDDLDIQSVDEGGEKGAPDLEADETPIVRFVNKVLIDAIKGGSSDIHFEPYEKLYRVRFRTDGILHEVARPPINLQARISARLKVMSQMDISERRVPQDGRIKMKLSKTRAIDFRVNTLPTLWGEKVVLRILDPSSAKMGIDALGYDPDQKELFMQALNYPQGMILVTGPTGSGKTVSLYTGLNILNTAERNISTAEDPVEINLEGINQVNVNPRVGLGFTEALRSFLRQDPDIIMVGEIRDLDTASIAIKAAQTGHMVMSTLHTNSAPETVTRLLNMGVPAFNLATSLNLIIAQRLARRLCSSCSVPHDIPKEALLKEGYKEEDFADMKIMKPVGCPKCKGGYKGRVGVYEVVKITPKVARTIMEGGNAITIGEACRAEGFNDLRRSGLIKAKAGLTSLEEVNRITKD